MRKLFLFIIVLMFGSLLGSEPYYGGSYKPIFMYRADMESAVQLKEAITLKNPGKIYLKDHFLFIVEKYKGLHVIDNSNPEDPNKKAFIHIDGCIDMAMKDNVIYADNAVDLIGIEVSSDINSMEVVSRKRNVFPEHLSPEGYSPSWQVNNHRPENSVLVRWELIEN